VLFQYAFARVLAHRFAYHLDALPIRGMGGSRTAGGKIILEPERFWSGDIPLEFHSHRHVPSQALFCEPNARLNLDGTFRHFPLIADEEDLVRDALRSSVTKPAGPEPGKDSLLVCIGHSGFSEEQSEALIKIARGRLHLLTMKADAIIPPALAAQAVSRACIPEYRAVPYIGSFQRMAICTNSTFWWGAYLSGAAEIYCLGHALYSASGAPGRRSLFVNQPRYIYDWQ